MKLGFLSLFLIKSLDKCLSGFWVRKMKNFEIWLAIKSESAFSLSFFLKKTSVLRMQILNDICVVDWLKSRCSFHIIYNVASLLYAFSIFFCFPIKEDGFTSSLFEVFKNANWLESEVWDLFGMYVSGSPDLRRMLTDYGFEGYPLRKDFPVVGYLQLRYNDEKGILVYEPVELALMLSTFSFMSAWDDSI